ncbi:hypothetical protein HDU99_009913, partial [Rhizoclosmatium hyalinum]
WVKTVLSYVAHASIRKQTTVMAFKKLHNGGTFFAPGQSLPTAANIKSIMVKALIQ